MAVLKVSLLNRKGEARWKQELAEDSWLVRGVQNLNHCGLNDQVATAGVNEARPNVHSQSCMMPTNFGSLVNRAKSSDREKSRTGFIICSCNTGRPFLLRHDAINASFAVDLT